MPGRLVSSSTVAVFRLMRGALSSGAAPIVGAGTASRTRATKAVRASQAPTVRMLRIVFILL